MLGLFKKVKDEANISLDWNQYKSNKSRLLALLEEDTRIIDEERKSLIEAINALKKSGRTDKKHLSVIKKRLDLVHSRLLSADKLASEETKHLPIETTTLKELSEIVDKIIDLFNQKRGT